MGNQCFRVSVVSQGEVEHRDSPFVVSEVDGSEHDNEHVLRGDQMISNTTSIERKIGAIAVQSSVSVVSQDEVEHRDSAVSEVDGTEQDNEHVLSGDQMTSITTSTQRKIRVVAAQSNVSVGSQGEVEHRDSVSELDGSEHDNEQVISGDQMISITTSTERMITVIAAQSSVSVVSQGEVEHRDTVVSGADGSEHKNGHVLSGDQMISNTTSLERKIREIAAQFSVSVVSQGEVEHHDSVVSEVDVNEHDNEHVLSGDQMISITTSTERKIRVIAAQSSVSVVSQGEVEHCDSVVSEVDGSEHAKEHVLSGDQLIFNTTSTERKIRVIAAQSSELFDLDVVPSHNRVMVRDVLLRFPSGHFLTSFDAEAKHELKEKLASPLNDDAEVLADPNTVYILFPSSRLRTRVKAGEYTHFARLIEMHELRALRQAELEKEEEDGVPASRALGCRILERTSAKRYCDLDLAEFEEEEEGHLLSFPLK